MVSEIHIKVFGRELLSVAGTKGVVDLDQLDSEEDPEAGAAMLGSLDSYIETGASESVNKQSASDLGLLQAMKDKIEYVD